MPGFCAYGRLKHLCGFYQKNPKKYRVAVDPSTLGFLSLPGFCDYGLLKIYLLSLPGNLQFHVQQRLQIPCKPPINNTIVHTKYIYIYIFDQMQEDVHLAF